jgi:Fe-S-cluster containining protein
MSQRKRTKSQATNEPSSQLSSRQSKSTKGKQANKANASAKSTSKRWYSDGLRFTCTQCGDCCSGEPGYVWVDQDEINAMAEVMGLDADAFEHRFVRQVGTDRSLVEYPDGDCILLDPETRRCTVYAARPIQCRTWPFWDSNLKRKQDWKATCEVCPGAGAGRLYSIEEIERARKQKSV